MSKADNLKDFLTDVADAIRSKKGTTDLINPQNFSAEILALSGGLEVIEMTETTATIEPNKVYVWGMVESLDITLGASTGEDDFFAFRFRCSKPTMTVVTVNGATWAEDTELDAGGKPILDLGSYYQCEIKGGTSALYARLMHYIPFEDSNVEAVLMNKGIGDGIGITYADAAKVTTISTWFRNNADITAFDEFAAFSGITSLVKYAFQGCSALTEIAFPASLTSIGSSAFNDCTKLAIASGLGNTQLTLIGNGAFNGCTLLKEIAFPPTLTTTGQFSFMNCKALTKASGLGDTQVTEIKSEFFKGCSALTEIAFPASLTSIGGSAFSGCSALTYIKILATTPPTLSSTSAIPSTIGAIYVPDESIGAYQAATNWSSFASKIKGISEMPTE